MKMFSFSVVLLSAGLAGCASTAPSGPIVTFPGVPSTGVFGGVHVRYDSTIQPGRLYRTATKGPLEFGAQLSPFCMRDFEFIKTKVGPEENAQDYKDELSGKLSASASGISWLSALFDLSGGGEVAVTSEFKSVVSMDATELAEIEGRLGANCRRDIEARRKQGYKVFLVARVYRAKDTTTLTTYRKLSGNLSVGQLSFVTVGPKVEGYWDRRQTRTFRNTVVEIVPYKAGSE